MFSIGFAETKYQHSFNENLKSFFAFDNNLHQENIEDLEINLDTTLLEVNNSVIEFETMENKKNYTAFLNILKASLEKIESTNIKINNHKIKLQKINTLCLSIELVASIILFSSCLWRDNYLDPNIALIGFGFICIASKVNPYCMTKMQMSRWIRLSKNASYHSQRIRNSITFYEAYQNDI